MLARIFFFFKSLKKGMKTNKIPDYKDVEVVVDLAMVAVLVEMKIQCCYLTELKKKKIKGQLLLVVL